MIRGYVSVMAALKLTLIGDMFISYDLVMKHPVPTKRATVILIKAKSCSALLLVLLVCTGSYLQSVLRYTFIMLGTCHPA